MARKSKGPLSRIASTMHKGALRKKASAAGEPTMDFAREHKHDSGKTGMQSRLALTFAKHRPKGRTKRSSTRKSTR